MTDEVNRWRRVAAGGSHFLMYVIMSVISQMVKPLNVSHCKWRV